MSKTLYFAYGSNLHLTQMKDRCPDSEVFMSFILKNFKLVFRTVADIEKNVGSEVNGVIFKISQKDEKSLDRYEGVPTLYKKEYFKVDIEGHEYPFIIGAKKILSSNNIILQIELFENNKKKSIPIFGKK